MRWPRRHQARHGDMMSFFFRFSWSGVCRELPLRSGPAGLPSVLPTPNDSGQEPAP